MTALRKTLLKSGLISLALLSLAGSALYQFEQASSPLKVAIRFIDATNCPTTYTTREGTFPVTIASFRITNAGRCSLFQWPVSSYDAKHDSAESGPDYGDPQSQGFLSPGKSKTVTVVAPWTIQGPWRAGFRFTRVDWR